MARVLFHVFCVMALHAVNAQAQSGIRWSEPTRIASSMYGYQHPRIVLDRLNNPLIIWGRSSDESVFFSRWDGVEFTEPTKLNGKLSIASASWMGPQIASHGDTVYVVMKQTPENSPNSHIYIVRSEDGGRTFTTPSQVDNIADSISRFPTVTCDAYGNPIVGFMKFDAKFRDSRWVVSSSVDYGRTFTVDTKASGWAGATEVCDCCPGAVVYDNDAIAMLYRNNANDIRDIWMGISRDNGSSFSSGCNIDNSNWEIPNCPATGPDAVVVGDTLYTVFTSAPEGYYRTFVSRSSLKNTEHYITSRLPVGPSGASQQNYPRIGAYGNAVGIVWKQTVTGVAQLPMLFTNDVTRGFPETFDTVDLEDINNADIAVGNELVAVCWEDPNARVIGFRMGKFSSTATGVSTVDHKRPVIVCPNPTTDHIYVKIGSDLRSSVEIINTLGQVVLSTMLEDRQLNIDVSFLPAGRYTARVANDQQIHSSTIVILH